MRRFDFGDPAVPSNAVSEPVRKKRRKLKWKKPAFGMPIFSYPDSANSYLYIITRNLKPIEHVLKNHNPHENKSWSIIARELGGEERDTFPL